MLLAVQGSLIHQMYINVTHMLILMELSYILMKEEVYIWIGRKLSANPHIATPQILGFVARTKEGV